MHARIDAVAQSACQSRNVASQSSLAAPVFAPQQTTIHFGCACRAQDVILANGLALAKPQRSTSQIAAVSDIWIRQSAPAR